MEQWKADALRRAHEDEILAQAAKIEAANRRGKVATCPEPKRTKVGSRIKRRACWATNCSSCWQLSQQHGFGDTQSPCASGAQQQR